MKLGRTYIRNFMAIGEIEVNLADKGLVLIQGKNDDDTSQDSNGSGKSSFPDAISWCLFGVTARGETGDAVINDVVGKDCVVETDWYDNGVCYRIARHRKHKVKKNALTVGRLDPATSTFVDLTLGTDKLTQAQVNEIVGCTEDVFNAAVYAGQEQMPDLPGMTDKFLKAIVEEAAGVNQLQAAHVEALKRERAAEKDLSEACQQRNRIGDSLATWEGEIEKRQLDLDAYETTRTTEMGQTARAARAAVEAVKAATAAYVPADHKASIEDRDRLQAQLAGVNAERQEEASLIDALSEAERVVTKAQSNVEHAKKHLIAKVNGAKSVGERVGAPCDECGKVYRLEDLSDATETAKAQVATAKTEAERLLTEARAAVLARDAAADALRKHRAGMTDTSETVAELEAVLRQIRQYEEQQQAIDDATAEARRLRSEIERIKTAPNPHASALESAMTAHTKASEDLSQCAAVIEQAEATLAMAKAVSRVFGPAGVRAHILDTVTPFLNSRTAHYLGILSDGNITALWSTLSTTAAGELREKFQIDVRSRTGGKSFKGLSGGEKRKARLATALALQDLVASRATKPIELFIGDEIDHALDESGLERLMALFDEKAREKGTVLAISHNSLSDWIRNVVTIRKTGGFARLEGSLS